MPIDPQARGLTSEEKLALNDARMGRALDQLSEHSGLGVFFQLALRSIKLFELETERVHFDTRTATVTGEYAGSIREPVITQGHNKGHKPHLKQPVFGLNVTADGAVPSSHLVTGGNRTDETLHRGNEVVVRGNCGQGNGGEGHARPGDHGPHATAAHSYSVSDPFSDLRRSSHPAGRETNGESAASSSRSLSRRAQWRGTYPSVTLQGSRTDREIRRLEDVCR